MRLPLKELSAIHRLIFLIWLFAMPVAAQDLDNVTISGKVTDQNGAVIPGATVTAKTVDTKIERSAVTDGDGNYKIIQLAPGKYTLTATAKSFQTTTETGLEFIAGRNAQIDLILFPPGLKLIEYQVRLVAADELSDRRRCNANLGGEDQSFAVRTRQQAQPSPR